MTYFLLCFRHKIEIVHRILSLQIPFQLGAIMLYPDIFLCVLDQVDPGILLTWRKMRIASWVEARIITLLRKHVMELASIHWPQHTVDNDSMPLTYNNMGHVIRLRSAFDPPTISVNHFAQAENPLECKHIRGYEIRESDPPVSLCAIINTYNQHHPIMNRRTELIGAELYRVMHEVIRWIPLTCEIYHIKSDGILLEIYRKLLREAPRTFVYIWATIGSVCHGAECDNIHWRIYDGTATEDDLHIIHQRLALAAIANHQ